MNRVFDSLADAYLCNNELANCFAARATLARMLEFEAALAHAPGAVGHDPSACRAAYRRGVRGG